MILSHGAVWQIGFERSEVVVAAVSVLQEDCRAAGSERKFFRGVATIVCDKCVQVV